MSSDTDRPGCWLNPGHEITERAPGFAHNGTACMNATSPEDHRALLALSPGCVGCLRAAHARAIYWPDTPMEEAQT